MMETVRTYRENIRDMCLEAFPDYFSLSRTLIWLDRDNSKQVINETAKHIGILSLNKIDTTSLKQAATLSAYNPLIHPSLDDINEILTMGKAVLKILQRKSADFEYSYDYSERVLINDLRNFEANGGGEMLDALLAGVPPEDIIPIPRK